MTAFHLTAEAAATAAAAAYREGRLGFQRGHSECLYRYDDGGCCAIGAGIPDDVAQCIDDGLDDVAINDVIGRDQITTDDGDALTLIQDSHDRACRKRTDVYFHDFLRAVNTYLPASVSPITAEDWADCPSEWREVA